MTLTQFRYLVAIADSGLNITVAAQRVHATQPGLSKQLKQLEDELGLRLFTRKGRNLDAITPAGTEIIERARAILAETVNIRALSANLRADNRGELRISTTHTQARYVLPAALASLKRRYPDVAVHLAPGGDGETLARLAAGDADLAIVSSVGDPPAAEFAMPLYHWNRIVLVPHGHALAELGRPMMLTDLADHPLVSYESSRTAASSLRTAFTRIGRSPNIAFTARDADLIKTYVQNGLGVGVMAEMALLPGDDAHFVALAADDLLPTCTTWLILRGDRVLRDFALALIVRLVPGLHGRDLRRALAGELELAVDPPPWSDYRRTVAVPVPGDNHDHLMG